MLTVMLHAKVKEQKLEEFLEMIRLLTEKTTKKGCASYIFNQNRDIPTDFVLYEQWENQEALDAHISELFEILGPARPGEPIPAKLMDMYETVEPVFYNIVGQS
ncbi:MULTISPECIES: putative quinol monooxygenase [unclassified Marinomonas]|uniref:putative quinol monooxygenase n=1 Tax=unclassified Marinomonas TaxID=196814 RepID=UPI0007AEF605|nr:MULTISPECIES: antibiotic biosynthesis monooxygenase [unclassified Marinomonas]